MYKALITDLDGTAVSIASNGSDINDATKRAVHKATRAGKKLACATGRDWKIAQPIITKLGFTSPCIIDGGTRIVEPTTGKTLWEKTLEENVPDQILGILKSETKTGLIMHSLDATCQPLNTIESLPSTLHFVYLLSVSEETAVRVSNKLNVQRYAVAYFTPAWSGDGLVDIHITHPQATKEHAIKVWQKREGVTKEEVIGLGDSGNDIPIFQSSGLKVAVGNATPSLKQLADYIAPSVDDQALEYVINTFLLGFPTS